MELSDLNWDNVSEVKATETEIKLIEEAEASGTVDSSKVEAILSKY